MNFLKELFFWIWQLPQNLLGLILLLFYKYEVMYMKHNGRKFYYTGEMPSGISLGNYIILDKKNIDIDEKHEYGHSIQSRRCGPLYLLVIGLPSLCVNIWDRLFHKKWKYIEKCRWYYSRFPEKQADRLGGADRESHIKYLKSIGY